MVSRHSLTLRVERSKAQSRRFVILSALFLIGCSPVLSSPTVAPVITSPSGIEATQTPEAPTAAPDFVAKLRNTEYQLGLSDSLQVVQLTDGEFEQGAPGAVDFISVYVTDFVAHGDLNADGVNEVAALVAENYGGSGVFVFLAVYAEVNGTLVFQTSSLVDDRPQLNALSIESDEIFLDAVTHGFDDPMCCPELMTTRHFRLINGQLDMTDYTTFTPDGRPRTVTIESPSNGSEVFSSVQIKGNVAIAPFENNLAYRIYDVGGVELSAGAIMVTAAGSGAPGTFDTMIKLGGLLSGATIRIEVQDLNAADGSLFAMDSVELVVK